VRIEGEGAPVAAERVDQGGLTREGHGGEVYDRGVAPRGGDVLGRRRDGVVVGSAASRDHVPPGLLVQEPHARAWRGQLPYALQGHAAGPQGVESGRGVVRADDADAAHGGAPGGGGEGGVEEGAAGLLHAGRAVGQHDVVDEQVARQHEGRGRHGGGRARKAAATARVASGSRGLSQRPRRFTDEPTMKPWARAYRPRLSGVRPEPMSTGSEAPSRTASRSAGAQGSPVAAPVTITPVGGEELCGARGLGERHVGGEGVRGVLLLDVGEDAHMLGAEAASVPQERARAGLDEALVGHVGEGKTLDAHEVCARREGHRERLPVRRGQHLNAQGQRHRAAHLSRDGCHGGDHLGPDGAVEVRPVVHVFEQQRGEARIAVGAGFVNRLSDDRVEAVPGVGRAGQGARVDHAEERAGRAEEGGEVGEGVGHGRGA
jgi:hypothetical protein